MIDVLVGAGFKMMKRCEVLSVSNAGYYLAKTRPMSLTMIRRERLIDSSETSTPTVMAPACLAACKLN